MCGNSDLLYRYSSGVVESMEEELFYEVLFDQDCTVCYNLPPSDLLVCGLSVCQSLGYLHIPK